MSLNAYILQWGGRFGSRRRLARGQDWIMQSWRSLCPVWDKPGCHIAGLQVVLRVTNSWTCPPAYRLFFHVSPRCQVPGRLEMGSASGPGKKLGNWSGQGARREQGIAWKSEGVILFPKCHQQTSIASRSLSQLGYWFCRMFVGETQKGVQGRSNFVECWSNGFLTRREVSHSLAQANMHCEASKLGLQYLLLLKLI